MRRKRWIWLGLVILVSLSGCVSQGVTPTPIAPTLPTATFLPSLALTETQAPATSTISQPTRTLTPHPTITPLSTLEPQQAATAIKELLQSPQCLAPCFWGITPGQTTLDEAMAIFAHLGLSLKFLSAEGNQSFYGANKYRFPSGLSVEVSLIVQDLRISTVSATIGPERPKAIHTAREWLAYSPETLIRTYGTPSRVDLWGGMSHEADRNPGLHYLLNVYFDAADLIVEYNSAYDFVKTDPATGLVHICPVTDQFQGVGLWLGNDPYSPPSPGVSVTEATSMTVEGFSSKIIGDVNDDCFDVSSSLFNH